MCRTFGVSHSHFLGGPPRWTADDRDKARALELYLLEACPQCGTFESDWLDPASKRRLDEPRWMPVARRCYGCEEIEYEKAEIPDEAKGVYVGLAPWVDPEVHPEEPDDEWPPSSGVDLG